MVKYKPLEWFIPLICINHSYHSFFFKYIYLFIYFWLRWVFIAAHWLSLVAASGGLLFVAVRGLLIVVASLVAEHRLYAHGIQ